MDVNELKLIASLMGIRSELPMCGSIQVVARELAKRLREKAGEYDSAMELALILKQIKFEHAGSLWATAVLNNKADELDAYAAEQEKPPVDKDAVIEAVHRYLDQFVGCNVASSLMPLSMLVGRWQEPTNIVQYGRILPRKK